MSDAAPRIARVRPRRAFAWIPLVTGVLAAAFGALWLAGPEGDGDGPADPIVAIRRPALALLRAAGITARQTPATFELWLPKSDEGWQVEPVYRAVFVLTGWRVTRTVEHAEADAPDIRAVRLVADREGGTEVLAQESQPDAAPDGARRWRVHGFVPSDAKAFRVEEVREDGSIVSSRGCVRGDRPPGGEHVLGS